MRGFLVFVLVAAVAVGALGYWRGWFTVSDNGKVDVEVNKTKFQQDKATFGKTVSDKAHALEGKVDHLWHKSQGLTGDEKVHVQKEITELKAKRDRLERQIKDLDDAGQDKFESLKEDLSKNLDEVEKKIDDLSKKLEKVTDK
jgi:uncharacterized coiled-coil DUF342 family protein